MTNSITIHPFETLTDYGKLYAWKASKRVADRDHYYDHCTDFFEHSKNAAYDAETHVKCELDREKMKADNRFRLQIVKDGAMWQWQVYVDGALKYFSRPWYDTKESATRDGNRYLENVKGFII